MVSSPVAVFIFQFRNHNDMERFVVKDPRVAAAYAQRRAAQNDVAAAQAAEEASRKKRQAAELGLIWPPPKRVGGGHQTGVGCTTNRWGEEFNAINTMQ